MPPSEHEIASPSGTSERPQPELALRLSKEPTPSGPPNTVVSRPPESPEKRKTLSGSEPALLSVASSSSLLKPRSSSNLHSGSNEPSLSNLVSGSHETYSEIIIRSFAPRVAVFASSDAEDFVREKGFTDGLYSLLKPYGERLQGKVVVRDSMGGSRGWDDFGVRFMDSQALLDDSARDAAGGVVGQNAGTLTNGSYRAAEQTGSSTSNRTGASIDSILDFHIRTSSTASESKEKVDFDFEDTPYDPRAGLSSLYSLYLRKLLSSASLVPYETFSHPVTCLIAVSSRHPAPIEALRQLYLNTGYKNKKMPSWMGMEYLRYYVLIHDEENDDITKSTALFDLMKRHFGLHCHLLRLRRSRCVQTDDDSTRVPSCEWLSAREENDKHWLRDYADNIELSEKYIFESDSTAIKNFLREMVTQSIVPFMESRVVTWNDQVASRRRGLSGRFMSLSKRWTGFGVAKSTTPGPAGVSNPSGSNYDYHQGFYPPGTPESTMRQLGDYAFMLRDWKLAYSIYDFLRSDFGHDKAWTYHAAANEMAAITSLLIPHAVSSRVRSESLDHMLEDALYSYLTRCSMPFSIIRCLVVVVELLITRVPNAVGDAARWGAKMLEIGVLTPIPQALITERVARCYLFRTDAHLAAAGTFKRQAAFWSLLASDSWLRVDKPDHARFRLREACVLYSLDGRDSAELPFPSMQGLWQRLHSALGDAGGKDSTTLIDTSMVQDGFNPDTLGGKERLNTIARSSVSGVEGFKAQHAASTRSASFNGPHLQDDGFE